MLDHSGVSPSTSNTSLQAEDDVVYMKAWPSWQGRPMQAHRGMQTNSGKDKLREGDAHRPDLNSLARPKTICNKKDTCSEMQVADA